jgi:hypothetical protein
MAALFLSLILITGGEMFMPRTLYFLDAKLSVGLMAVFQNEF